jgi:hypothetical protein
MSLPEACRGRSSYRRKHFLALLRNVKTGTGKRWQHAKSTMPMLLRFLLCATLFLLGFEAAAREPACSRQAIDRAAAQVEAARQKLRVLPIGGEGPHDLSPTGRHLIEVMKARLGDLLDAYMRCAAEAPDPAAMERDLSSLVPATIVEGDPAKNVAGYGQRPSFAVRAASRGARLIGITATFQIECGTDTALFVFARDTAGWKEALRWQSRSYKSIAGAFWSFDYVISPPDETGHWFVVAKNVAPWCSSTWSLIRYAVLRPATHGIRPRLLLDRSAEIWWGSDDAGRLTAGEREFELRFHASSIDLDIPNRFWIRHFRVVGDKVQRTAPVAVSPRDFVDEWIVSSWPMAAGWSSRPTNDLAKLHDRLHRLRYFTFLSARRCSDAADRYQLELQHEDDEPRYFFRVTGGPSFRMIGVATKAAAACDGEDILASMETQ